jgi:hypothetical protein
MRAFFTNNWIHIATGAFFALITVSLFAIAMCRGLSRDEHQFIAAGALLATEGLLPYRDFPYFHVPNLIFVYAGLFRCSSYLLLTSRLFSVLYCNRLSLFDPPLSTRPMGYNQSPPSWVSVSYSYWKRQDHVPRSDFAFGRRSPDLSRIDCGTFRLQERGLFADRRTNSA